VTGVSLVMPLYNEAADVDDVLRSIAAQDYPHDALYAVVVDGGSTDGSRERVERWLAGGDVAGRLVANPRRTIPTSLNLGIAHARPGDLVIRLDAHTTYAPDYVRTIAATFDAVPAFVGCVGGAQTPERETDFGRALVAALYTNPLGLGGAGFRRARSVGPARGVYLGAWRPGVVVHAGGFDETWEANEDAELAARIRALGYTTLFVPARSAYRVKRGPLAAVRQWGRYGFWRAQTLRRHPGELRLRHLLPPLALGVAAVLLLTPLRALDAALFLAYAGGVWLARERGEPARVTLAACAFFPACQIAWTAGLVRGLLAAPRARLVPHAAGIPAGH
jgi:glycosyltransferase involved in cell wall biosynthesis